MIYNYLKKYFSVLKRTKYGIKEFWTCALALLSQ